METATNNMSAVNCELEDMKDGRVPAALYWTIDHVSDWIQELGFPQYKECFTSNLIDGRRLVTITASTLSKIGIYDFEHNKIIAKSIRDLLTLEEPDYTRSITLPPRNELGMYVEMKSVRGVKIDNLNFPVFLQDNKNAKWQPPLANHCLILPFDTPPGILQLK